MTHISPDNARRIGRWAARLAGAACVLFFLIMLVGEGPPNWFHLTGREQVLMVAMVALFGGLAVAWKWPLVGALITLAGWVGFSAVEGKAMLTAPFLVPVAAALLHLACRKWVR